MNGTVNSAIATSPDGSHQGHPYSWRGWGKPILERLRSNLKAIHGHTDGYIESLKRNRLLKSYINHPENFVSTFSKGFIG